MSRECECKEASVESKYQQSITISMEEYKELLIIKGKYEEATKPKFEPYTTTTINAYKSSSEGKHLLNG